MTGYRGEARGGGPLGKREAGGLEAGKLRSCRLENEDGRLWNGVVVSQLDVSKKDCFLGRGPVLFFSFLLLLFDEIESGARPVQNKAPTPGCVLLKSESSEGTRGRVTGSVFEVRSFNRSQSRGIISPGSRERRWC